MGTSNLSAGSKPMTRGRGIERLEEVYIAVVASFTEDRA
jgi:hypothetical protein